MGRPDATANQGAASVIVLGRAEGDYCIVFDDGRVSLMLTPNEAEMIRTWLNAELAAPVPEPESLHDE